MTAKNVLVIGGAGFIGSHACQALAAAGYQPVVFDNLSTGAEQAVLFGPLVVGDIRDEAAIKVCIEEYKPIAIMHFAALIKVGESVANPADYYEVNVLGTWKVLNAIRATHPVPVVFSSTAAVYGIPETSLITEDATLAPINPYGQTKLTIEHMLADYSAAYNIPSVSLRYFNAAGASLDGAIGLNNDNPTHLIPVALEALMGTRPNLEVYGTDYPTPDGTAIRDYIHVADLATAHVAALEYLLKGGKTTALNLGTGQGHSVSEVIGEIERITGKKLPIIKHPRRAGDPPALVADSSLARKVLGWQPRHSSLATIIETAWKWRQSLAN